MGFPSPGGAIQSIDRSGLPITRGHEVGKHLSTSVSHPHFEMACTLYYIRNVQVRRSSAIADTGHAADALTRTHFRHASLNNGINRPWRVINCRCPPDMTVYSFVRRANVPNIYGIPSVGLGLKSDPVFSTCFTHTRVRTRVDNPSVWKRRAVQTNQKILVLKIFSIVLLIPFSLLSYSHFLYNFYCIYF